MSHSVFISYAYEDKSIAERVSKVLTEQGLKIYSLGEESCLGKSCIKQVGTAMNGSDVVLVIMTKNSVSSPWLNQELGYAMASGKHTVLLVGNRVPISGLYSGRKGIRFNEEDPESVITALSTAISSNNALDALLEAA